MPAQLDSRLLLQDNKYGNLNSELLEEPVPKLDRNE
jgi:hypothetical protein